MKIGHMVAAGGLALASLGIGSAANAQERHVTTTHRTTTVTRTHGPMRLLPHHKNKVCRTVWRHHHRERSCSYR